MHKFSFREDFAPLKSTKIVSIISFFPRSFILCGHRTNYTIPSNQVSFDAEFNSLSTETNFITIGWDLWSLDSNIRKIFGFSPLARTVLFESHPNHISECSPWKSLPDSSWVFENRLNISNVVSVHKFSFREDFAPLLTSRYVSNGDQSNLYNIYTPVSLVFFAPSEVSNCGGAVASADTRCPPPDNTLHHSTQNWKLNNFALDEKVPPPDNVFKFCSPDSVVIFNLAKWVTAAPVVMLQVLTLGAPPPNDHLSSKFYSKSVLPFQFHQFLKAIVV